MHDQINICKSVQFELRCVSQIREYITKDACNHVVRSNVLSRLDYCNGLLTDIKRLQRLQNWAARIFKVELCSDPSVLLRSLHWLSIKQRVLFKILLLVYKTCNKQAQTCINNCLELYMFLKGQISYLAQTLFVSHVPELVPRPVIVLSQWQQQKNGINFPVPISIKSAKSVPIFKKMLKTYLFPQL